MIEKKSTLYQRPTVNTDHRTEKKKKKHKSLLNEREKEQQIRQPQHSIFLRVPRTTPTHLTDTTT